MSSLVPQAAAVLAEQHPGIELGLTDTHPEDALHLLRAGHIDVAADLPVRRDRARRTASG